MLACKDRFPCSDSGPLFDTRLGGLRKRSILIDLSDDRVRKFGSRRGLRGIGLQRPTNWVILIDWTKVEEVAITPMGLPKCHRQWSGEAWR
jgi:hypothetical protein